MDPYPWLPAGFPGTASPETASLAPAGLLPGVLLGLVAGVLLAGLAAVLARRMARRRRRGRARSAGLAEDAAEAWLRTMGYRVVSRQARQPWPVRVGSAEAAVVDLRADLLVIRRGRLFVAEVKRGHDVARVRHGPTRRQLLEYLVAFDADGVLLVDALRRRVDEVTFPELSR